MTMGLDMGMGVVLAIIVPMAANVTFYDCFFNSTLLTPRPCLPYSRQYSRSGSFKLARHVAR